MSGVLTLVAGIGKFGPLSVSLSPSPLDKAGATSTLVTGTCTGTVTGGSGGNTYAWTKVSGDAITCDSPTAAATTFRAVSLASPEIRVAVWRLTVTDSMGHTATADVTVTIERS